MKRGMEGKVEVGREEDEREWSESGRKMSGGRELNRGEKSTEDMSQKSA